MPSVSSPNTYSEQSPELRDLLREGQNLAWIMAILWTQPSVSFKKTDPGKISLMKAIKWNELWTHKPILLILQ